MAVNKVLNVNIELISKLLNVNKNSLLKILNQNMEFFINGKGYFMGGYTGVNQNEIDGIIFSSDSFNNPSSVLSLSRRGSAGFNSSLKGYAMGGDTTGGGTKRVDGILFSNDSAFNLGDILPNSVNAAIAFNNYSYGYIIGAYSPSYNQMSKMLFSSESFSTTTHSIFISREFGDAVVDINNNVAYLAYGNLSNSLVNKINLNNDSSSNISSSVNNNRIRIAGYQSNSFGYFAGGRVDSTNPTNIITKIGFSSENFSVVSSVLSRNKSTIKSCNSNVASYIGGGDNGPITSFYNDIDKFLFSGESCSKLSASLAVSRSHHCGVQSGGYI